VSAPRPLALKAITEISPGHQPEPVQDETAGALGLRHREPVVAIRRRRGLPPRHDRRGEKVLSNKRKESGRINCEFLPALFSDEYDCEMILVGKPETRIAFESNRKRSSALDKHKVRVEKTRILLPTYGIDRVD
jgi:hypothetical protein